ncbi:MAG: hypothetical protein R3Y60_05880 [bacterium]
MRKNKISNKGKAFIFILVCIISACSYVYIKLTTPPTLESILSNTTFNTSEVTLDVTISNKNTEVNYTYVISEKNDYIKTIKKYDNKEEVSVVYKVDSKYYLYVNKGNPIIIELTDADGLAMLDELKTEVNELELYLDVDYNSVKYYTYSEELITFSSYNDYVFYDYELVIVESQLVSLLQTFTVNNVVNTVEINVIDMQDIIIPTI